MPTKTHADTYFDVIVIGSGMGGITAASLLSQLYGQRVLIVEKHWTFGGLTHEFSRGKTSWDVGLHYVGQMREGTTERQLFDFITGGRVRFNPMPERYDQFVFPGFRFAFSSTVEQTIRDLTAQFPAEAGAIRRYYRDVRRARRYFSGYLAVHHFLPGFLQPLLRVYAWLTGTDPDQTLQAYLDRHVRDARLKGVLSGIWGDYGALPREASFLVHAILTSHYAKGAYYPDGGAGAIGQAARTVLETHGATVLLRTEVTEILTEGNRATGVRIRHPDGTEGVYQARHILSSVGAERTYNGLLRSAALPRIRADLARLTNPHAFVGLYLRLRESPARLGFDGSNVWHFGSTDQNQNAVSVHDAAFPGLAYLSFPTLKGHPSPRHTVEVLSVIPYADVAPWQGTPWQHRGEAYEQVKATLRQKLLARIEAAYPGFGELVDASEVSTPLSLEFFTSRRMGAAYGLLASPERFRLPWLKPRTPFQNLYLCGQDVCVGGIVGAMMGGVVGAAATRGPLGFFAILMRIMRRTPARPPALVVPAGIQE